MILLIMEIPGVSRFIDRVGVPLSFGSGTPDGLLKILRQRLSPLPQLFSALIYLLGLLSCQ